MSNINLLKKIIHLDTVDSTNNYAAKLYNTGGIVCETVIMADIQTNGRGQREKTWQSDPYQNLTFSVILPAGKVIFNSSVRLVFVVSLSISRFLSKLGLETSLKWPNDIYVDGKKIAGILIENNYSGSKVNYSIIGIGLNVNQKEFGITNATSLSIELSKGYNLRELLLSLLSDLNESLNELSSLSFDEIVKQYNELLFGKGEKLQFREKSKDKIFTGEIIGVNKDGDIFILVEGEEKAFKNGEVDFLGGES